MTDRENPSCPRCGLESTAYVGGLPGFPAVVYGCDECRIIVGYKDELRDALVRDVADLNPGGATAAILREGGRR